MEKKCIGGRGGVVGRWNPHPLVPVACLWPVDDLSLRPLLRPLTISLPTLPWRTGSNSYHTYLSRSFSLSHIHFLFLHYRGGHKSNLALGSPSPIGKKKKKIDLISHCRVVRSL
ncbi:hypothetical protein QQF64_013442 [Cirrhinus molitorella]|uniref:Uncharacterized protein n=1 Tax=Cirrhinus molitorella TaxID=172907 RepID=A0ABR3LR72_9TELE